MFTHPKLLLKSTRWVYVWGTTQPVLRPYVVKHRNLYQKFMTCPKLVRKNKLVRVGPSFKDCPIFEGETPPTTKNKLSKPKRKKLQKKKKVRFQVIGGEPDKV